jgi:hypothetical protein
MIDRIMSIETAKKNDNQDAMTSNKKGGRVTAED